MYFVDRRWLSLFSLLFVVVLSACATLSENQCKQGDWYDIGVRDGSGGYGGDRLNKHSEACQEYGVAPNREAYEKGRGEGLKSYCSPDNAYHMGRRGGSYRGGCPAELETAFLRKFEAGRQIYEVEARVNSLYRQITNLENDMDKEKDVGRRVRLREQIRDRQREKDNLQRRLTVLEIKGEG